ncbi:amidoligase enzyme-domain-containing protein [Apiospora sp. TS-2023a]
MQFAQPPPPRSRRPIMTHGKEVEFLARYVDQLVVPGTDPDKALQRQKEDNPGVVVVPYKEAAELVVPEDYTRTLEMNGVDVNPSQGILAPGQSRWVPAHPNAQYTALPEFHRWTVYEDSTVVISPPTECHHLQQDLPVAAAPGPGQSQSRWYGLELISPAQPNTSRAHQETAFVLGTLRQSYGNRMRVNESCGLHIHVGMGPDAIPVPRLRRIAALLYAADPLLAVLHPPHRQNNRFCPSIRRHANVTWGMVEAMATAEVSAGACSVGGTWTDAAGGCGPGRETPVTLRAAVAQLLNCDTGYAVARLLQYRDAKSNYNFNSYLVARSSPPRGNVTVEFRQHEGTLDARRIEAWARLCVGITEWAAFDMTEDQLGQVVAATERVEREQQQHQQEEVIDALRRDGLRRLLEGAGMGELVVFYGLQQQKEQPREEQQGQGWSFRRASL